MSMTDRTSQWVASLWPRLFTRIFIGLGSMHSEAAVKIGFTENHFFLQKYFY